MRGGFEFNLISRNYEIKFTVERKIIKIIGDSAKGKSELVRRIAMSRDPDNNIKINCKYPVTVLGSDLLEVI